MKQELDLIGYIQFDHLRWLNELLFTHKEIELHESRLLELMEKIDEETTVGELADLYDNFNLKGVEVKELMQKVRNHVANNSQLVHANGNLKKMIDSMHTTTRKEIEEFRENYIQLKKRFNRFSLLHDR